MADVCACSTAGVIGPVNGQFQGYTNFIHTGQLNLAFDWFNGVCVSLYMYLDGTSLHDWFNGYL